MRASEIAKFLEKDLFGGDIEIKTYSTLSEPFDFSVIFVKKFSEKYVGILNNSLNILAVVVPEYKNLINCRYILSENPRLDFLRIIKSFFIKEKKNFGIHKSAFIEEGAVIGENTSIGVNAFIGSNVIIGKNTTILHNVVIEGNTTIGDNCYIKSGAVIGEAGFGFEINEYGVPEHFPHSGKVEISNGVFLGSNSTVEVGTIGKTFIGENVKIDDLVQIGHNSQTGKNTLITVGSILCGGAVIGENCYLAPNVTIKEKVVVNDNAFIGMGSVVIRDVESNTTIIGNPGKVLIKK